MLPSGNQHVIIMYLDTCVIFLGLLIAPHKATVCNLLWDSTHQTSPPNWLLVSGDLLLSFRSSSSLFPCGQGTQACHFQPPPPLSLFGLSPIFLFNLSVALVPLMSPACPEICALPHLNREALEFLGVAPPPLL